MDILSYLQYVFVFYCSIVFHIRQIDKIKLYTKNILISILSIHIPFIPSSTHLFYLYSTFSARKHTIPLQLYRTVSYYFFIYNFHNSYIKKLLLRRFYHIYFAIASLPLFCHTLFHSYTNFSTL